MFAAWPQEARRRIERLARVLSSEIPSSTEKIVVQVEENTMTLGHGMQRQPWPYTGDAWFCCPQICHWKYFGVYRNLVFLVSPWPIWTLDVRYVTLTKKWYAVSHSRTTLKCGKRQVQLLLEYFAKLKSLTQRKAEDFNQAGTCLLATRDGSTSGRSFNATRYWLSLVSCLHVSLATNHCFGCWTPRGCFSGLSQISHFAGPWQRPGTEGFRRQFWSIHCVI